MTGAFGFSLALASDDGDENPYNINISGMATAPPAPNLSVTGATNFISPGVGVPVTVTWQVANTGTGSLTISDITVTGAGAANFSLTTLPGFPHTIASGGLITMKVLHTPIAAGPVNGVIRFTSDSGGTAGNVLDVAVTGLVIADISAKKGCSCSATPEGQVPRGF